MSGRFDQHGDWFRGLSLRQGFDCERLLSHAFPGELKAVSVVNEAIQDSVAEGGVADNVVPMFDRDLADDDGRGATVAIIKDRQKVAPFVWRQQFLGSAVITTSGHLPSWAIYDKWHGIAALLTKALRRRSGRSDRFIRSAPAWSKTTSRLTCGIMYRRRRAGEGRSSLGRNKRKP